MSAVHLRRQEASSPFPAQCRRSRRWQPHPTQGGRHWPGPAVSEADTHRSGVQAAVREHDSGVDRNFRARITLVKPS
jgi:hypothetical protein